MDFHIRLSPKVIRLTDERDAPAAKRSGWVSVRANCGAAARSLARSFRVAKVARRCAIFVPIAGGAVSAAIRWCKCSQSDRLIKF